MPSLRKVHCTHNLCCGKVLIRAVAAPYALACGSRDAYFCVGLAALRKSCNNNTEIKERLSISEDIQSVLEPLQVHMESLIAHSS